MGAGLDTLTVAAEPPAAPVADGWTVAVSPAAYDACVALGGAVRVVDDVVDRVAALPDTDAYLRWQSGWFARLDGALGAGGAVECCALVLKYAMDSLVTTARLAGAVVDASGATAVAYVGELRPPDPDPLHAGLPLLYCRRRGDAPLWGPVLAAVTRARGLPLAAVAAAPAGPDAPGPARSWREHLVGRLGHLVAPFRHLDAAGWRPNRPGAVLLTWPGGYGSAAIAGGAHRQGERVVTLDRDRETTRIVAPGPWGRRPLTPAVAVAPLPPTIPVPGDVAATVDRYLGELDPWCATPGAAEAFRSRLTAAVTRLAPVVGAAAGPLAEDLHRLGVTSVVAANPSSVEELAVLLAARRAGIATVLAQHGDYMFSYDGWLVGETPLFDLLLSSDPTVADDLATGASRLGVHAPAVRYSEHRRPPPRRPPAGGGPVYYVPAFLWGDTATIPATTYEDSWYHRWHLELLDLMVRHPETEFVWKALPAADQVPDPVRDAIARRRANVRYETRPFRWLLGDAGRVLVDVPSTPVYEAAWSGIPLLVLAFPELAPVRASAAARFGPVYRPCRDRPSALATVEQWLADDPRRWTLPQSALRP